MALREATSLDPLSREAHFNLAVVYATQTPPSTELAREHYDKAQKLGYERLPGEAGSGVEFNHVCAVRKERLSVGTPLVENAKVTGVIVRNARIQGEVPS